MLSHSSGYGRLSAIKLLLCYIITVRYIFADCCCLYLYVVGLLKSNEISQKYAQTASIYRWNAFCQRLILNFIFAENMKWHFIL